MRARQFSISSLVVVIAVLGVAFAALRRPSYLWANVTFSLALAALLVAVLNAILGQAARRAYWLGFALCGGAYFLISAMPGLRETVCPRLASEPLFDLLYPHVAPQPPSPPTTQASQVFLLTNGSGNLQNYTTWTTPIYGTPTPASPPTQALVFPQPLASNWAAWTEPDRTNGVGYRLGTVSLVSSEAYRQIGHSMMTLLVGVLGAVYARRRYHAADAERRAALPA
jgi:hypothetical protein